MILAVAWTWARVVGWQLAHNTGPALIVAGGFLLIAMKVSRVVVQWWLERKMPKRIVYNRRAKAKHEQAMAWGEWVSIWALMLFGAVLTVATLYLKANCT